MTEKGIGEASKIAKLREKEAVSSFDDYLKSLPPKVEGLCRYLLKTWLIACEDRVEFNWNIGYQRIQGKWGYVVPELNALLPPTVIQSVSKTKETLVEKGLAANASIHHITSGPSEQTLVTCPEIHDSLLNRNAGALRRATLDEYLSYMLNGLRLFHSKDWLLHLLNTNQANFFNFAEWVNEHGLWPWLRKLESCGYVQIRLRATEETTEAHACGPGKNLSTSNLEVYPLYFTLDPREAIWRLRDRINEEVRTKLEKWFETGEEVFQRFEIELV
jgi:hypothetical protein